MSKNRMLKLFIGLLVGGAMVATVACGGDDDAAEPEIVVHTVVVTEKGDDVIVEQTVIVMEEGKEVIKTEEVVVTATPVPAAPTDVPEGLISAPTTKTPAGTVVVAFGGTGLGAENGRGANQASDSYKNWGVAETMFRRSPSDEALPWVGESFTIAPDLSSATIKVQQGIPFQVVDGFDAGDLTAHDVAFSMNDHNGATNPESIGGQAGDFAGLWGEWVAVDDATITFDFVAYDGTWQLDYANQSGQAFNVFSEQAFIQKGEDWVADHVVATGPFQIEGGLRDESFTIVNRPGTHWLAELEPKSERIQVLQVSEPATRLALLRTGDVDMASLEPKDAAKLDPNDFTMSNSGGSTQHGLFFSGNLWEDVYAGGPHKGETLPTKATFVHDLPWIGSPGKHGDDDMEQAKAIRRALALAIDRDLVNESLVAGLGNIVDVMYFSSLHPNWPGSSHEYPYDPDEAVALIKAQDPDYQKGSAPKDGPLGGHAFEISVYAQGGSPMRDEIAAAVAGFWADIGLTTFALKFSYQTFRPTVVGRTNTHPWVTSCDKGKESNPWYFPKGLVQTTLTRGGFGCGFESPVILELYTQMAEAPDTATATAAANVYLDYVYEWNLQPGIVAVPDGFYWNNSKIKSYEMDIAAAAGFNSLWNIEIR